MGARNTLTSLLSLLLGGALFVEALMADKAKNKE